MKKLAVIGVLILFLVNTMGYFIVFRYYQYMVQHEMIARIRCGAFQEKITILKLFHPERDGQFHRIKNTEFSWYGKLYDVVAEVKTGDTTLFYCLRDNKEEELIADYSLYLRRHGNSSQRSNAVVALLYNLITQALIQNPVMPLNGQGIAFNFPVSNLIIIPVYLVHSAPPPKTA